MQCGTEPFSIGRFFTEKNAINASPEYQREGNAWGIDKKQLFLDTLFNRFDLPKIYLHALKTNGGLHDYALVDGKQRLQCIWDFMDGKISLGSGFEHKPSSNYDRTQEPYPKGGDYYKDLSKFWQQKFRDVSLDVVVIRDADEADIEEIFSRLNNGEPLNAAEKRNAMGGNMCKAIRALAQQHKFFTTTLLPSKRFQHYDFAARFLLIEKGIKDGSSPYRDLKKRFLDDLVLSNKTITAKDISDLNNRVKKQLNPLVKIFDAKDPLLKQAGYPQLYYLFVKEMEENYASPRLTSYIKEFISDFAVQRVEIRKLTPEQKFGDESVVYLDEFERLMQQGNDENSLKVRVHTMRRFFLLKYPSVKLRDTKRNFTEEERYAIYILGGKKCAGKCQRAFLRFDQFEADHVLQWAHGGSTTLENARALCKSCNAKANKKVA